MNCALVTGASRGLGKAIAVQLAKDHGLYILVNYASNHAAAEETLAEIKAAGGDGELLHFQVQSKAEVDAALNGWRENNPEKYIIYGNINRGRPIARTTSSRRLIFPLGIQEFFSVKIGSSVMINNVARNDK